MADDDPAECAVKTWRYLRLAMILLVVGLAAAIWTERERTRPSCMQSSVSGYYYTPVRGFFVAGVLAVGVCLVALKARRESEDTLLNLAGMFAPIVALVPTANEGGCWSFRYTLQDRDVNIANNVGALVFVGFVGLLVVAGLAAWDWYCHGRVPGIKSVLGMVAAVLLWVTVWRAFYGHHDWFLDHAHNWAAVLMFVCIFVVVVLNALDLGRKKERSNAVQGKSTGKRVYANRYAVVAVLMVTSVGGMVWWNHEHPWDHLVLAVEAAMILLFAVFWGIQTGELWDEGLRPLPDDPAAGTAAAVVAAPEPGAG